LSEQAQKDEEKCGTAPVQSVLQKRPRGEMGFFSKPGNRKRLCGVKTMHIVILHASAAYGESLSLPFRRL